MDSLEERMAGEITLSDSPGSVMKKWRELFGITQVDLSKEIKISPSTISDYESNRRLSPGVGVIKRFVEAILYIDENRGGVVKKSLDRLTNDNNDGKDLPYEIHDFIAPINGIDFNRIIEGKIVASQNYLDNIKLFGYTKLDSLRVILEMSPVEYPKLFSNTNERVFIFENVSTGRSPMVVIRIAPIKPKIVLIPNLESVDKLAIRIAQIEGIPLITTKLSIEELESRLNKL